MNTYTPLAAALTMVAAGAPLVCQAQDPAAEYKGILADRQAGKNAEALARVDKVLAVYGNPTSRVAKQFAHFTPFFYWQRGEILTAMGETEKAYQAFNELRTKELFKDKNLIARSKEIPGQQAEGYAPLLTAALFQMGNLRYQQAAGKNGAAGDPAKYDEAIPLLEEYLKYYESGKATKFEQNLGLDGKVCFLLLQSYLLKSQPDFNKAALYMEKGKKAKAALPDDMVMNGLNTVLSIALKNPQYIGWGEKMISSNTGSFHLSPDRMAPHSPNIFNSGVKSAKMWEEAMRAGDMKQAMEAARTTYSLFGLVPDAGETVEALTAVAKMVGNATRPIPDRGAGVTYDPARIKKLQGSYEALTKEHRELEAYILLTLANSSNQLGSARLAKAGYKVLIDRYPGLRQKKDDGFQDLRDINYLQYAQLSRTTGDEATALKYEQMLDPTNVGDGNRNAVVLNKMARLVKEKRWEEALPVTEEALQALAGEKGSLNYISAAFSKLAALYMLHHREEVLKVGEELLNSGMLSVGQLNEKQVKDYETQALYFVVDAAKDLGQTDPAMLDKSLQYAETFMSKYPSLKLEENNMAPNVYYDAITVLMKRRGHGKAEAEKQDLEKALRYCDVIAVNWEGHDLYPTARLLAGTVLISSDDDAQKPGALVAFEDAANAALKQGEGKGKSVASNALYWLASYSPEYDREGETKEAKAARIKGYFDRFWKEADYEGNAFALQMAGLQLSRALDAKNVAEYDKALQNAQTIIAREAAYAFHNNRPDPELEATINSYVLSYVDGQKQLHDKTLTLEEKTEHLRNFPGVLKEDKYTNAILHMALLTSMNEELVAVRRSGDAAAANNLERDIARSFRQMRDQFKPEDLTNFICVQVGNYEVDYARRLPSGKDRDQEVSMALSYFEQVLTRKRDMVREATLGKANALSLSGEEAKLKEAYTLYSQLTSATDPSIVGPALIGLTDLNMSTKNYKAAVGSASKFINMRNGGTPRERMAMMMKLGEAYCESGDVTSGLQTYMNLYGQNRGNITFSAPACKAMMEQYWKRNNPSTGDRLKNNFKQSDRWLAWNTGQNYVDQIRRSGIEAKMTPAERDLFNEVTVLLAQYAKDPKVQQEDRDRKNFQAQIRK